MPYKEEEDYLTKVGLLNSLVMNPKELDGLGNGYHKTSYGGSKQGLYLNIKDSDMKELYKFPKFKEIVSDTFIEELILGKFQKVGKLLNNYKKKLKISKLSHQKDLIRSNIVSNVFSVQTISNLPSSMSSSKRIQN